MVVDLRVLMRAADFVLSSSLYSAISELTPLCRALLARML